MPWPPGLAQRDQLLRALEEAFPAPAEALGRGLASPQEGPIPERDLRRRKPFSRRLGLNFLLRCTARMRIMGYGALAP